MTDATKKLLESLRCGEHEIPLILGEHDDGSVTVICPNCANICRHCRRPLPGEVEVCGCGRYPYLPPFGLVEYCENCAKFCAPDEAAVYAALREQREASEKEEREAEEAQAKRNAEYLAADRLKRAAAKERRDRAKGAT
jgi:hypothetical protein